MMLIPETALTAASHNNKGIPSSYAASSPRDSLDGGVSGIRDKPANASSISTARDNLDRFIGKESCS